jgi:hypothetical protein
MRRRVFDLLWGAQAAKGVREKEAKVQRELEAGPRPPEDPVAHQLQEIEVPCNSGGPDLRPDRCASA